MKGSKLEALKNYLLMFGFAVESEINLEAEEKNVEIGQGELVLSETLQKGYFIGLIEYAGNLYINGFVERDYTEKEIISIVQVWLNENDAFFNRAFNQSQYEKSSSFMLIPLEEGTETDFELVISVLFRELAVYIEDANGKLPMGNKKYRLANPALPGENFEQHYLSNCR